MASQLILCYLQRHCENSEHDCSVSCALQLFEYTTGEDMDEHTYAYAWKGHIP